MDTDKITSLILIMKVLIELMEDRGFETEEEYLAFRELFASTGLEPWVLDEKPTLDVLQMVTKAFAELNFEDYKDVSTDDATGNTDEVLQEQCDITETNEEGQLLPLQVSEKENPEYGEEYGE